MHIDSIQKFRQIGGVVVSFPERLIAQNAFDEADIRADAFDHHRLEITAHSIDGINPILAVDNNLNNQTVVKRRDGFTFINHRNQVNVISGWQSVFGDLARCWHKRDFTITVDYATLGVNTDFKAIACFTGSEVLNAFTAGD